jgi:hypothetical protein
MAQANITKKRKFVADGVFYAELNEVIIYEQLMPMFSRNTVIPLI